MNSHTPTKTIRLEQPPQLLNILNLNYSLEQAMLDKINRFAVELNNFIKEHYPAHLDQAFKISLFRLDKDQASLEHNSIYTLFKKTKTSFVSLNAAINFLKTVKEKREKLPDGNYLKNKINEFEIDDVLYDIHQKYYGNKKNLISFLLSILMHKKAEAHDRSTKNHYRSSSEAANRYHVSEIHRHQKLMKTPCEEFYQQSAIPAAVASSLLIYITHEVLNHLKQSTIADVAVDHSALSSKLLNSLIQWVCKTEEIDIATISTANNQSINLKMILEIISVIQSLLTNMRSDDPTLSQTDIERTVALQIVTQFQSRLLEPNQIAAQILEHRIHKMTEETKRFITDVEFNSSQEIEALNELFRDLSYEQCVELLLNQYSLFIISDRINNEIDNHLNNPYCSSDPDTYFSLLQSMTTTQQEEAYLTLLLGLQFIEYLKYLEKAHFSDFLHEESTNNQSKLLPTQHNRRLQWYSDCLREAFYQPNNEDALKESATERFLRLQNERAQKEAEDEIEQLLREEGIAPKRRDPKRKPSQHANETPFIDCTDALSRQSFLRDLHFDIMNIFITTNINKLCESLDETLTSHLSDKLDSSQFDDYQTHLLSEWKRVLNTAFEQFKTQLHLAARALKTGNTEGCEPLTLAAITIMKSHMPQLASKPENLPSSALTPTESTQTTESTTTVTNYKSP